MAGRLHLELNVGRPPRAARRSEESPLHVLLLGDFGGRELRAGGSEAPPLFERPILALDVDALERAPARCGAGLELPAEADAPPLALAFESLDDFHPDRLYERVPLFRALRDTRARLADPARFAAEAAGLRGPVPGAGAAPAESVGDTLERLLGRPAQAPAAAAGAAAGDLRDFVRRVVAPHVEPGVSHDQARLLAAVDQAAGARMRALLHHPRFQTLEAIWRSTAWLVSRLETGERLTLSLLDVTREELARDLDAAGDDLARSSLHRRLVDRGPGRLGGEPWSLLVGHFCFGPDADAAWLLARLGAVAARAGGPFLAGVHPSHLGVASLADGADPERWTEPAGPDTELWQELRASGVAPWIGLALPRLLLRLPYGARTDPIDAFAFEETTPGALPGQLLWGSPAVGCAWLLARAFEERGWRMAPGDVLEIDDLPAWVEPAGDAGRRVACAEAQLSDRAAEALAERGFLAFRSHARRNGVRLLRFQSVASPPAPLAGPWA